MAEAIYALKTGDLTYSGLTVLAVKIGKTTTVAQTLTNYKRKNKSIELLDLWLPNKSLGLSSSEKGAYEVADKYAYERNSENFVFLQDEYQKFSENISKLLVSTTRKELEEKSKQGQETGFARIKDIDDYTGKKPQFISLKEDTFKVNSWRDTLEKISKKIYHEVDSFLPALKISGRSRNYFARKKQKLVRGQPIDDTGYYFEGDLSATQIVSVCKELITKFGYDEDELEIYIK